MSQLLKQRTPPPVSEIYRFLKGYFGRKPVMVLGAFFCVAAAASTSTVMPLVHAWLVDSATTGITNGP